MASEFAIDLTKTQDYIANTAFDYVTQNDAKNEIIGKYNGMLHLTTGHTHNGTNSRSLASSSYTIKDVEAMIVMGVYR